MVEPVDRPAWGWVEVYVEPHDALPDGASMRFKANDEPRTVTRLHYESDDGDAGVWEVRAPGPDGIARPAMTCLIDDSGAGQSALVYGGDLGLRLRMSTDDGDALEVAEPWLLLDPADVDPR